MPYSEELKTILLKSVGTRTREENRQAIAIPYKEVVKFQLENGFKAYNAQEGRQKFIVVAKDIHDAKEQADVYNAVIIGENKNYKSSIINPK